jgi:hypothetical protein
MNVETVYIGHDNAIDLILKMNGVAYALTSVTKMTISVNGVVFTSQNNPSDPILWNQAGYQTGEIRIFLGMANGIVAGSCEAPLVVYDAGDPDGIVWDIIPLRVVAGT